MVKLHIAPANGEPYDFVFDGDSLILGRSTSADLALADPFLSRHHARLYRDGQQLMLEDLESRNGTVVNGRPVEEPTPVGPGDVIRISGSVISLDRPVEQARAALSDSSPGTTIFRPANELLRQVKTAIRPSQVRGERALRRAAERLGLLNQIHEALGTSLTLEELLELILDRAFDHLQPEQGSIFLKKPEGAFYRAAQRTLPGLESPQHLSRSLVSEVAERGMAALVQDVATDERFSAAESMIVSGVRSLVAAPLRAGDEPLGMIVLSSTAAVRQFAEEDMELLVSLASVAALKIHNVSLAEEAAQRRVLEKELSLARRLQVSLLPDQLPTVEGYAMLGRNTPSRRVSGDYYQVLERLGGRECVLLVADVAGKGVAASLVTVFLDALSAAPIEDGMTPAEICSTLSRRLLHRTPPEKYATAFLAVLEPKTGRLSYTNAGHNPAIVLRRDGTAELLEAGSMPLGLVIEATFDTCESTLESGDTLIIYTDGITEAENPDQEQYGLERLTGVCQRDPRASVEDLAVAINRDLEEFAQGVRFADDRTLVLTRRLFREERPSRQDT